MYINNLKQIDEIAKFLAVIVEIFPKCTAPAPNIYYVAKELYVFINSTNFETCS